MGNVFKDPWEGIKDLGQSVIDIGRGEANSSDWKNAGLGVVTGGASTFMQTPEEIALNMLTGGGTQQQQQQQQQAQVEEERDNRRSRLLFTQGGMSGQEVAGSQNTYGVMGKGRLFGN